MTAIRMLMVGFLVLTATAILADNHSCQLDRPYPRGWDACDSCPWEETLAEYRAGNLSEVRKSKVFDHQIRVSVVCDRNRPVDVEDVYDKVEETERMFMDVFGDVVEREDGDGILLEVIVGICDYYDLVDDCNMYEVCNIGLDRPECNPAFGQTFANSGGLADHVAFVPYFEEGTFWWTDGNRYGNLQWGMAHLLDYTYILSPSQRGSDTEWWVHGMPQFIQWKILNDSLSWNRGNNNIGMLEGFTDRWNTMNKYDSMRVIAYLNSLAPSLLEEIIKDMRNGIISDAESQLYWHYVAFLHERSYKEFVDRLDTKFKYKSDL